MHNGDDMIIWTRKGMDSHKTVLFVGKLENFH